TDLDYFAVAEEWLVIAFSRGVAARHEFSLFRYPCSFHLFCSFRFQNCALWQSARLPQGLRVRSRFPGRTAPVSAIARLAWLTVRADLPAYPAKISASPFPRRPSPQDRPCRPCERRVEG